MVDVAKLTVVVDADTAPAEKGLSDFGGKLGGIGNTMALAFTGAAVAGIAAVGAGLATAVTSAADFEKTMAGVKAVMAPEDVALYGSALADLSLKLGKDTAFSASEAAKGIEELTKGGLSATDILNGAAEATLNLAAAGGVSLPDAATIAANALAEFNLKGEDMAHVSDLIAGAANASALDVSDFKFSLTAAGAVAATVGFSFDDLAQAIAVMGKAGITGSDAGTSLKTMMMNLSPQTKKATDEMRTLGIITEDGSNRFFDAQGKVKSFAEVSQILQEATADLTNEQKLGALQTMFGSDAIRAAAVAAKEGAAGVNEMAASMGKVSAAAVGAARLDNVTGAVEQLKGSIETLAITVGMKLLPGLRVLIDTATKVINALIPIAEDVVPKIVDAFEKDLGGIVSWFTDNWPLIERTFNTVARAVSKDNDDLASSMSTTWGGMSGTFRVRMGEIGDTLRLSMHVINGEWSEAWGDLVAISDKEQQISNANTKTNAAIGQKIIDLFTGGMLTTFQTDMGRIGKAISDAWGDIKTDTDTVTGRIGKAISDAWGDIKTDTDTVTGRIGKAVSLAWGDIKTDTDTAWGLVVSATDTAWSGARGVAATIGAAAQLAATNAKTVGTDAMNGLQTAMLAVWSGTIKPWLDNLGNLMLTTIRAFDGGPAKWLYDTGVEWLTGLKAGWDAYWTAGFGAWLGAAASVMVGMIVDWGGGPAKWLYSAGSDWLSGLKKGWDDFWTGGFGSWLGTAASVMVGMIVDWGGGPAQWLFSAGNQWLSGLKAGWDDFWNGGFGSWLGTAASVMVGMITDWGGGPLLWLFEAGNQWLTGLKNGWDAFWNTGGFGTWLGGAAEAIVGVIVAWGGGPLQWLYQAGFDWLSGLKNGWDAFWTGGGFGNWLAGAAADIVGQITGWAGGPAKWLYQAGADMIAGFQAGIDSAISGLKSWIETNLTSALPEWVRSALKISSPSLVFAEIGSQLVAGLIEGLKSRTSDLLKAATDMATKLVGSFDTVGDMGGIESVLKAALEYTHKPESWLPGLKWIVSHESGGDAGAKNPHSTASGLFQLIDSTWAAYRDKNLPNDVFNPMANAVAGINYIDQRYGNPDKAVDFWKANNYYGDGGIAWSPQMAHVAEKGPEAIIPLNRLGGIGGGTTIQIVVQGSLVAQQELETVVADAWRRAARSGRL